MTHSEGKAIVRRLCEDGPGLQALTGTLGTGTVVHAPASAVFESLADVRLRVEDQIAEGDLVASRLVVTGEAPHATPVRMTAMAMHRLLGGRIVEVWLSVDLPHQFPPHPIHINNELKEIPMQTLTSRRAPMDTVSTPMPVTSRKSTHLSRVILPIALVLVATIAVLVALLVARDTSDSPATSRVVRSATAAEGALTSSAAVVRSVTAAEQPVVTQAASPQGANTLVLRGPS